MYSCGGECNGNTYALSVASHTGSTWVLEYDIKVQGIGGASGYTGSSSDLVHAISFKDFMSSSNLSAFSVVQAPGGAANWTVNNHELNANGCGGGASLAQKVCVESNTSTGGAALTGPYPSILTWQVKFTDSIDTVNVSAGDIKFLYIDSTGNKVGSLGSWSIGIGTGTATVPEPSAFLLLGTTLALLGSLLTRSLRRGSRPTT